MGAGHRPSLLLPSLALGRGCRNPRRGWWLRRRPGRCAGLAGAGLAEARARTGLRHWSLACPLAGVRVPYGRYVGTNNYSFTRNLPASLLGMGQKPKDQTTSPILAAC